MLPLLLGCVPPPSTVVDLPTPPATGVVEPGWYALDPLPEALQEVSVLALDGEVWVLGGFDDSLTVSDRIWILGADGWRAGPLLPEPLHHLHAAVVDGQILVLGGMQGLSFTPLADAWVLDPDTEQWSPLPSLPSPLGAGAVGQVGREIQIAGGLATGTETLGYAYDVDAQTWRSLPDLPAARDHAVGAGGDGLYVLGGRDNGLSNVREDVYVLEGGTWNTAAPMPTARAGTAGAVLPDGRVFVAGGEGNIDDPDGVFDEVEIYDPATDTWEAVEPMPTPRHGTGAAVFDGGVVIPGGATVQAFQAVDTVEWWVP